MLNSLQNSMGAEGLLSIYIFENHPMDYLSVIFPGIFFFLLVISEMSVMLMSHSTFLKAFCVDYGFVLLQNKERIKSFRKAY